MLLSILLAVTSSSVVFLAYKNIRLQKERQELLKEIQNDSKALFLKSRYVSMGETVGNIAHQWKQPLNAVGTILNSLKATILFKGEISQDKLLTSVETSFKLIQHLAETIDTFYSFLSPQHNTKSNFMIADELEKIKKITEYSFGNSNILLQFELEANPIISGNANEFTHAMLNIILNAKDAFDRVSISTPKILVHVSGGSEKCNICISDNAGGIKLTPIEMVFDLHISTKESGSGLGLFMTKNIIENRFGGKISAINKKNGACFTIELPYAEYGKDHADIVSFDEKLTLDRINKLSHKVIALEEVEKALRQWEDIFTQTHWGVTMHKGTSDYFEMVNPAFHKMYGYSAKELKKMTLSELFAPEYLEILALKREEAFAKSFVSFESMHVRKDGNQFPVNIDVTVIKNEYGEVLYHITNIRDITEQKVIANALKTSEEAFRAIVENSPDVIMRYDRECRRTYINPLGLTLMGKPKEELLGKTPKEFSVLPDLEDFEKAFATVITEAKERNIEGEFLTPNGEKRWGEQRIVPELNQEGRVVSVLVIGRDITELRKANQRLLLKKFALDNINESVFLIGENSKFHYVNESACHTLGYTKEELLNLGVVDIDPNISMGIWKEHWEDIKNKKTTLIVSEHTRRDKSTFPIEVSSNYFEYEGVGYSLAVSRDVTEKKAAEENLLLKEFALNKISEAVFLIDEKSNFHYLNEAAYKSLGYTEEELMQLNVMSIDPTMSQESWIKHWSDKKTTHATSLITYHQRKDGAVFPIEVTSNHLEYKGIGYNLAVTRDITERLEAEKRKDDQKMRLFFERQLVGMAITSLSKKWLHVNDKLCEMLGYSSNELQNMTWEEVTHPEDLAGDVQEFNRLLHGEIEHYFYEKRFIKKDGDITFANLSIGCVRKEDRTVDYLIVLIEDITERKKIEKELVDSYLYLNQLIDSIPDPVFVKDREHRWVLINKMFCSFVGLSKEMLLGKSDYDVFPKKEADVFWKKDELVFCSATMNSNEEDFTSVDGVIHFIETVKTMFTSADGKEYLVGTIRDITEKKVTQEKIKKLNLTLEELVFERTAELAKKEMEFRTLAENMPNFLVRYDREKRRIYINPAFCNYVGIPSSKLLGTTPQENPTIDLSLQIDEKISYVLQTAKKTQMEVEGMQDGRKIYWNLIFAPEFDANACVESVILIGHDISNIKEAQSKILQESEKFSKLFMSSPAAVSVTSIDRNMYLEVNDSFLSFTKYTREEIIGESSVNLQFFVNPEERSEFFRRVFEEGAVREFEFEYRAKDGTAGYGVAYATLLYINEERCVLTHSYDINERKQLELLNVAIDSTSEAIYITDETLSIIYVNEGACTMLGYTKEELTSMKIDGIEAQFTLDDIVRFKKNMEGVKQVIFETKHKTKDGKILDIEITGSTFMFNNKTVELSVAKDITHLKERESKIEELNRILKQNKLKR